MIQARDRHSLVRLAAGAMLVVHAWLVIDLIPRWSVTYNESAHISAGLAWWYTDKYNFYDVNPPLPRIIATCSLLNQRGISLEALSRIRDEHGQRQDYEIGKFFADTNALDFHQIICRARLAGVFWVTLGGIIIWRWADRLYGARGGLTALALWTFEPTVTAHAAVATGDIPTTVMGLVATFAFARFLRTGAWVDAYIVGLLLGAALLCKFTMVLLLPAWGLGWVLTRHDGLQYGVHMLPMLRAKLERCLVILVIGWLILSAGYAFTGTGTPIGKIEFISDSLKEGLQHNCTATLPCPIPAPYLHGIDTQQKDFEGRMPSYLRGEWRNEGWWYFYIYAFGVKTPLGHLTVYGISLLVLVRLFILRRPSPHLLWVLPSLLVLVASSKTGFTSHLRYVLPAYPFVMILAGASALAVPICMRTARYWLIGFSLMSSTGSIMFAYPHLLGYFNASVGGGSEGWRHLADSNVDWGQDWIFLRDWLAANEDLYPVHVALMGHVDSQLYLRRQYPLPTEDMSGYAVVDVQNLTRKYSWLSEYPVVDRIGTSIFVVEVRP